MDFDLTALAAARLAAALHDRLKDLAPGETAVVRSAEDPELALRSVNLLLRDALRWEVAAQPGAWVTQVRRTEDVPPRDVLDALRRDHRRLDRLYAQAIHDTDAGLLAAARASFAAFLLGLDKHLRVEHDLLAAAIPMPPNAQGESPSVDMLQEHGEILVQARMIEATFAEADCSAASVGPLLAILAGYLAKHEQREEERLYPLWQGALARAPEAARAALLQRTLEILT